MNTIKNYVPGKGGTVICEFNFSDDPADYDFYCSEFNLPFGKGHGDQYLVAVNKNIPMIGYRLFSLITGKFIHNNIILFPPLSPLWRRCKLKCEQKLVYSMEPV